MQEQHFTAPAGWIGLGVIKGLGIYFFSPTFKNSFTTTSVT